MTDLKVQGENLHAVIHNSNVKAFFYHLAPSLVENVPSLNTDAEWIATVSWLIDDPPPQKEKNKSCICLPHIHLGTPKDVVWLFGPE